MSGMRTALRIARREAWRTKGRSVLVVAMIGVPMLALSFADVAARTGQLPPAEKARRELGAADVLATFVTNAPVRQDGVDGLEWSEGDLAGPQDREPSIDAALPPGARAARRVRHGGVDISTAERSVFGQVEHVDLHDPLSDGLVRLVEGAYPRGERETALSERAARDLDAAVGSTVALRGLRGSFTVTGIVRVPSSLSAQHAYLPLAARVPDTFGGPDSAPSRQWAVALPPGARDVDLVAPLNRLGYRVQPRAWYFEPPPGDGAGAAEVGVVVVVAGLAALEIVLLAGAAFAVGARRRRRELALIAATGGDRRDVRRVVLAGAAVVGAVAGAVAVAGGVLAVVLLRPVLERGSGAVLGPLDVRPLELGGIVLLATGTALLAALLPARAASRFPVVAGLTGRRGDAPPKKRVPALALLAVAAGTAVAFWGAQRAFAPERVPDGSGGYYDYYSTGNDLLFVLFGAAVAELGFVACAPTAVTLVGRLARRLPLSLRLAARDAARHRTRSGPAVAAVVAAVAGSIALSVYLASDAEKQRREYQPFMASGGVRMGLLSPSGAAIPDATIDAAVAKLPVRERVDTFTVASDCRRGVPCAAWLPEVPERHACPATDLACHRDGPVLGAVQAGPPGVVEWATGRVDPAVAAAMRDGRAVVFDARLLRDGKVTLVHEQADGDKVLRRLTVPAVVFDADRLGEAPAVVMTPETARRHDLPLQPTATYLLTSRLPTHGEEAAARRELGRAGAFVELYVERGHRSSTAMELLVLAMAAGFVTLAATGIATGLAAADSRPDLATLAAVGAAPRIRRRLVMAQAATVAVVGSLLGVLAGLVPAAAIVSGQSEFPVVLPWRTFAITVVGVPLVTSLLVGLFTRARLPLDRRLT